MGGGPFFVGGVIGVADELSERGCESANAPSAWEPGGKLSGSVFVAIVCGGGVFLITNAGRRG